MTKTEKKIENQLVKILTDICETELKALDGFEWITHKVNFNQFPQSLKVLCVFASPEQLACVIKQNQAQRIRQLIQEKLVAVSITISQPDKQIIFDIDESCL
jgi:hypothetical protein